MAELLASLIRGVFVFVTEAPFWLQAVVLGPLGVVVGQRVWWWAERMAQDRPVGFAPLCRSCARALPLRDRWNWRCSECGAEISPGRIATAILTALLFLLLIGSLSHWRGQSLTEGGSIDWFHVRLVVQLVFVSLLVAATVIDLQHYIIPDEITVPGMLVGVGTAVAFGNLQFVPVWIDWNDPMTDVFGPHIPQWIKDHHHVHGLAMSLAGLAAGAGLTWLVRVLSGWILGQEALGFGDVTLMAMIGSFLGWQPVVLVFMLAPLCGLAIGLSTWLTTRKTELPYGPYLAAAALLILYAWKWLWIPSRNVFSDPQALGILFAVLAAGLVVLLGLIRLYRLIPVETQRYRSPQAPNQN